MDEGLMDRNIYDLFQTKVRDFTLMKDPSFRWCAHVSMIWRIKVVAA